MRPSLFALPMALTLLACPPALAQELSTPQAKASYAIGLSIGSSMRADGLVIDEQAFLRGVKDAIAKAKPALTDEEADAALQQMQSEVTSRRMERIAALAKTNAEEGEAFLKTNGAKPGVVTLPSGLQYQILTPGTGAKPTASDSVRTHYRGALLDGTEFDSSGQTPASFPVGEVIPGWTEALQLMPVGSKWRLFVPSTLAYGGRGAGEEIGPNATLVFEVELLAIE